MVIVSIIILTFNSIDEIDSCLNSLFIQDDPDFEIIIVDNGSKDGIPLFIKNNYSRLILIENKENLGAAYARNQGIKIAKGKWILTLDCDVVLNKDFFKQVLKIISNLSPKIGMIQPKILKSDRKTIYSAGIILSSLRRFYDMEKGRIDNGQFNEPGYIFGVCSAAALYKRQMLEDIKEDTGYFDERFFFLVEDVDLSWRAQRNGWQTLFYPQAVCYHLGNSSGTSKKIRQYLCFRNRYFTILKNENHMSFVRLAYSLITYDLPRTFYLLFTNRFTTKALGEIIGFLRIISKKRKEVRG